MRRGHVSVFVRSFAGGGGAERAMLNLAEALAVRGHRVDLVMSQREGHFLDRIPDEVRVVELGRSPRLETLRALSAVPGFHSLLPVLLGPSSPPVLRSAPALARYLERERPDALIAALNYTSLAALLGRSLAQVSTRTAISIQNHLTTSVASASKWRMKRLPSLSRRFFPRADAIIAASQGVADDLAGVLGIPTEQIVTIFNPVITNDIFDLAKAPVDHPWLVEGGPPVILGAGKLKPQKDFPTLLRAFARVRADRDARLLIIGEGEKRGELEQLARKLGVDEHVSLPGFVDNPFAHMARSNVFALSSAWEGFGNVVAEALACGCPVVSTDCPSGPGEILDHGRFGPLVAVGDDQALAAALLEQLDRPPDAARLRQRAVEFSADRAAARYAETLGLETG